MSEREGGSRDPIDPPSGSATVISQKRKQMKSVFTFYSIYKLRYQRRVQENTIISPALAALLLFIDFIEQGRLQKPKLFTVKSIQHKSETKTEFIFNLFVTPPIYHVRSFGYVPLAPLSYMQQLCKEHVAKPAGIAMQN